MTPAIASLLHLCDSLFPTGSFSHSDGLEAATASGQVASPDDLSAWMQALGSQTLRSLEGPAVRRAWQAVHEGDRDLAALSVLDDEVHALRPSAAGRDASRAMGSRLLRTWQQIRPDERLYHMQARRPQMTLPVAFGVVCAVTGVAERDAIAGYAYTRFAATLSSAMRLMPLGQQRGHAVLARMLDTVPALVESVIAESKPLMAFTPALDLATMQQQYVHSRLFRS